jgi:metal-responsive CopG/Arc/MetJ family transcriptional regulator
MLFKKSELEGKEVHVEKHSVEVTKEISITLPDDAWEWINDSLMGGLLKSKSDFIREILLQEYEKHLDRTMRRI